MSTKRIRNRALLGITVVALFVSFVAVTTSPAFAQSKPTTSGVTTDPCNGRLAIQVASDGTFNLGGLPDPGTCGATTGSFDLTYAWPGSPGTSFTTVRVDGSDNSYGAGTLVSPPTDVNATTNSSAFQHGDVLVTQTLSLAANPQTGQVDAARIAFTVHNAGSISHSVGIRTMLDTDVNNNDGAAFRIPGIGAVTTEQNLSGSSIPDLFQVFSDLSDSAHVAGATLRGSDTVTPDSLVVARWPLIAGTLWDYTIDPLASITSDSAYALYWNPTSLAPGAQRTYVTYFGLGDLSVDTSGSMSLGVSGLSSLTCSSGAYTPDPFDITATVGANGPSDLTNASVTLNLPAGLSLASGSSQIQLGSVTVGTESQGTWQVHATPQTSDTIVSYSVTSSADNAPPKTVQRSIDLPACAGTGGLGAPTDVIGNPSNGSAIVTWSPPTNTNAPIDSFEVKCTATGHPDVTVTVAGTESAAQVNGLTNGIAYTCVVRTHRGTVAGPFSDPSPPFTPSDTAVAQFVDLSAGGTVNLTPGQDSLGTSGQLVIPAQKTKRSALAGGEIVIVVASLFGTPGEFSPDCGGNVCVGQGIQWSISDPSAVTKMLVKFTESPALAQGENVKTANIYKDDVLLPNCKGKIKIMCVSDRDRRKGGGSSYTIKVDGSDPHGRH